MKQEAGTMELTVVVPNDWEKCFIIFVKAAWIVLSAVTLRKKINHILPTLFTILNLFSFQHDTLSGVTLRKRSFRLVQIVNSDLKIHGKDFLSVGWL